MPNFRIYMAFFLMLFALSIIKSTFVEKEIHFHRLFYKSGFLFFIIYFSDTPCQQYFILFIPQSHSRRPQFPELCDPSG